MGTEIALGVLLMIMIGLSIWLVPIALSQSYIFWGKLGNDEFLIRLSNGNFVDIKLSSRTARFKGGDDPINRWDIHDRITTDKKKVSTTIDIGAWPVMTAQRVFIPINIIDVIRPVKEGDRITYKITSNTIACQNPSRFLVHGFETTPVETKGGSGKLGECKINEDSDLIALITEILQVRIEIFNPYLALVRIPSGKAGQGFMSHVNSTLQSVAREVTAQFTYNQIIKAMVESGQSGSNPEAKAFGKMFKDMASDSLEQYGIRITDVDLLDHSLDKEMADALQSPQKAYYKAQETITAARASKEAKELEAKGDAAELEEIMKAVNGDKELAALEIARRGMQRSAEGVGKNFKGQFLTVNFAGPNAGQPGPTPAVTVGAVSPKERKGDQNKQQEKKKRS